MQVISLLDERAMRTINAAMKLFVVEYSVRENGTMIRTLDNVISDNIRNIKKGLSKDYLPVRFFASRAEADRFHARFTLVLAEQDELPVANRDWQRIGTCFE